MTEPTINDLHILLIEQKGDIKLLLSKYEAFEKWKEKHENDDADTHKELHERISTVKKYGGAISIVSIVLGWLAGVKLK